MTDQNSAKGAKGDDGRGQPPGAEAKTVEPQAADPRLITGGSFRAARTPIGMNAIDRADMPSFGESTDQLDYKDTPETGAGRPPHRPA
jgi:hypothetical protein